MDIVQKLRESESHGKDGLMEEAAREIDRLRTALHTLAISAYEFADLPYRTRSKYVKASASEAAKQKQSAQMKLHRAELTDYYMKVLLTKRGGLKFSDITPEMVRMKRAEMITKRTALALEKAAAHQIENVPT